MAFGFPSVGYATSRRSPMVESLPGRIRMRARLTGQWALRVCPARASLPPPTRLAAEMSDVPRAARMLPARCANLVKYDRVVVFHRKYFCDMPHPSGCTRRGHVASCRSAVLGTSRRRIPEVRRPGSGMTGMSSGVGWVEAEAVSGGIDVLPLWFAFIAAECTRWI